MENTNIQNVEKPINEISYKQKKQQYNKERYQKLKEKMKEQSSQYYIKKITENPEYRNILNERTKKRHQMKKEGTEPRPKGRPKTTEKKEFKI